ncbi:MAG: hypothetical protein E7172_04295 [Firmicutes bacterium]|nr:hypothetical protein [Bacillota bacterium]
MKFYVTKEVFAKLPNLVFGLVSVYGVDNGKKYDDVDKLLDDSILACENHFAGKKVKEDNVVKLYRESFEKLEINPNKFMVSIEALLTRISKQKGLPHINAIVDLGNAISLKYYLPIGAHDLDSMIDNEFCIRLSKNGDKFIPFKETEGEEVDKDEVVYATKNEIRTRRWIWRQSEKGKITEKTSNLLFIIDGFAENKEEIIKAREELKKHLETIFKCQTKTGLIDKDNLEFIS